MTIIIRKVHPGDFSSRLQRAAPVRRRQRRRLRARRSSDASGAERCTSTRTFSRFISDGRAPPPTPKDDLNRSEKVAPPLWDISGQSDHFQCDAPLYNVMIYKRMPANARERNPVAWGKAKLKPELKRRLGSASPGAHVGDDDRNFTERERESCASILTE